MSVASEEDRFRILRAAEAEGGAVEEKDAIVCDLRMVERKRRDGEALKEDERESASMKGAAPLCGVPAK